MNQWNINRCFYKFIASFNKLVLRKLNKKQPSKPQECILQSASAWNTFTDSYMGFSLFHFSELPTFIHKILVPQVFTEYNQLISHHAKFQSEGWKSPKCKTREPDSCPFSNEFLLNDRNNSEWDAEILKPSANTRLTVQALSHANKVKKRL